MIELFCGLIILELCSIVFPFISNSFIFTFCNLDVKILILTVGFDGFGNILTFIFLFELDFFILLELNIEASYEVFLIPYSEFKTKFPQ